MASSAEDSTNKAGTTVDGIQVFLEEIKIQDDTKTSRGFGVFLVELEKMLTLNIIRNLATVFSFQPGEIDQIERNQSASYEFTKSLRDKGIISQQDISKLIESLKDIKLHGVAKQVTESYNKNVQKGTLPPHGITSDEEALFVTDKSMETEQGHSLNEPAINDLAEVDCNAKMSEPLKEDFPQSGLKEGMKGEAAERKFPKSNWVRENLSGQRLTIQNFATYHLLYVQLGRSWKATTSSTDKTGEQNGLFKVQWCEQISDKIAKTVLIRTDAHPQSLLDVRDLCYQGRALDSQKCYDRNRWWKLIWLEIADGGVTTVLFQSYTQGTYLAEKEGSAGVEVIQLSDNVKLKDVPDRAKWNITIKGLAFRSGQEDVVRLSVPVATVMSAFTDGSSGPMAAAFAASGATTLAEAVGTASAIAAGTVLHGITPAAATLLHGLLKDVSHAFFMDW